MKEDEEQEKWSQLPTLLVWMIKDRLNFADTARVSFVCKNWKSASLSYPSKPTQQCIVPWLVNRFQCSTSWEFVNLLTKEKLIIDRPEFHGRNHLLFSRRGWLLLHEFQITGQGYPIVLLNIHTNAKIIMSGPGKNIRGSIASFSSSDDGTPQHVVFALISSNSRPCFYIAKLGEENWIKHSYRNGMHMPSPASLLVLGHEVYCLDMSGGLFIFNMVNLLWREVAGDTGYCTDLYQWRIVESEEGEILKIDRGTDLKTFSFFKLNDSQSSWVELNHDDVENRSWFVYYQNNNFTVKETKVSKKVYDLRQYVDWSDRNVFQRHSVNIHDLMNGTADVISTPHQDGYWVDLGSMDKVPPSCVHLGPTDQYKF
ncbi:hypothetical protein IFM89_026282 [Coptis chinensis]|uniref:F-box domain-containing protein n=1 Tax=Coptis chinensis TaxID=261450 RepID=A0A835MDJ1_9MAGN|nr:hypothetical protein IFM89_026282 [Coptis chinensis]